MKKKPASSTSAKRPSSSSSAGRGAAKRKPAKPTKRAAKPTKRAAKPTQRAAKPTQRAVARPAKRAGAKPTRRAASTASSADRWLRFVAKHGVVLASARGPVPSVAEAVAGEPIIGSWWAHPKGKAIFAALSEIDDCDDVRCFKLIDNKVTFVHRRYWPALAKLATDGVIAASRLASIEQEHMPSGEHRNLITPFPDWLPDDVAEAASALSLDDARGQLGPWL